MSAKNKFHLNGSTVLSLNERFTRMQGRGGVQTANRRVEPRHSQSRSRIRLRVGPQPERTPRISIRNRSLLAQLDQKHLLRAALKLKRKSLKMKSRSTIGYRQSDRPVAGSLMVQNKRRRKARPNNVAKQIATIKADLLKNIRRVRQLNRSDSQLNLNAPLNTRGRPRLKRNNNVNARITSRGRSRSRNRIIQYGTKVAQNPRKRSISRQRSASTVKLEGSKSRVHLKFRTSEESKARPLQRQQIKPRPKTGQREPVNNRKQIKRQNNSTKMRKNDTISNMKRGRITKKFRQNQQRSFREQPGNQMNRQKRNGRQLHGKKTSGQVKKQSGKRNPVKSKEQLDAELDQYMVNTTLIQDQNIGLYTK